MRNFLAASTLQYGLCMQYWIRKYIGILFGVILSGSESFLDVSNQLEISMSTAK